MALLRKNRDLNNLESENLESGIGCAGTKIAGGFHAKGAECTRRTLEL